MIKFFSENDVHVSICSDIWSDHWQEHSYMGITCHFINDRFELEKRVLAFRLFDDVHSASHISAAIQQVLEEYRLLTRCFSISFDNASNNTASIDNLIACCQPRMGSTYFHVRCVCHILNLCVKDGLEIMNAKFKPLEK